MTMMKVEYQIQDHYEWAKIDRHFNDLAICEKWVHPPTPTQRKWTDSYFFLSTVTLSHISLSLSSLATCSTIGARYRPSYIVSLGRGADQASLPAPMWSTASLVALGVELIAGMPFAYGMHGRMTLVGIVGQLPGS